VFVAPQFGFDLFQRTPQWTHAFMLA
jgi:hypothetical protein